ncbi:hypothetical protein J7643_10050 [bacterium]|nr:hypothetical protein [bacterium]
MRAPSGIGKALATPDGRTHGRVSDVVFDLATGLILGYEIVRPDLSRRMVPAIAPVREDAERIVVPPAAIAAATEDLSALMALRDPVSGAILFPLAEED